MVGAGGCLWIVASSPARCVSARSRTGPACKRKSAGWRLAVSSASLHVCRHKLRIQGPSIGGKALPDVPNVDACVREALDSLQRRSGRDPQTGRFVVANVEAGGTLARSDAFWSAVAGAKAQIVASVCADLGGESGLATTLSGLIDGYAEARLFRQAMGVRLMEMGGPVTGKGKGRMLYTAYLGALDREMKLAQLIGLERRAKPVERLEDVLAQHEETTQ